MAGHYSEKGLMANLYPSIFGNKIIVLIMYESLLYPGWLMKIDDRKKGYGFFSSFDVGCSNWNKKSDFLFTDIKNCQ